MSNFGLEVALRDAGLKLVRTEVGDPAVVREMRTNSYNLGGEQSGHVIFMDHSTTGDGLITALLMLSHMAESNRPPQRVARDEAHAAGPAKCTGQGAHSAERDA